MQRRFITLIASVVCAGALATGCSLDHTDAPDPAPGSVHPGFNQEVIQEPDGFRNVAFSCHGSVGVYVTSRGQTSDIITSGVAVLANDPNCVGH